MQSEKIIRQEAKDFLNYLKYHNADDLNPVAVFKEIKIRLNDFYSSEYKAIFLDEIELITTSDLEFHRKDRHKGKASPNCAFEIEAEKILFYINQELDTLPKIAHQKFKLDKNIERKKVFVSYSHSDKEFLFDIQRHFKPFLNKIDFWDDSKITPGAKWKSEIIKAIKETKVAILLVSTDFLGSDFIANEEIPPLLELAEKEGATILIVILKPCLFEEFDNLNQFQAMNSPNNPVSKMEFNDKEELYVNLVRQTKKILENQ